MTAPDLQLGLIGDNIANSQAPHLHRLAGWLCGLSVVYDRLVPPDLGQTFDQVFDTAQSTGFRGLNITYPYKEQVTRRVHIPDPLVQAIGAVNTVIFEPGGPVGFNTDHTGFIAAYKGAMRGVTPGTVCLIGTGGAGKAVAFGLIALGADAIRCVDLDLGKARALADALRPTTSTTRIDVYTDPVEAAKGADGLINCTPVGMVGYSGTPLPATAMVGVTWAFDAVYTPIETQFLQDAAAHGLTIVSGYELFFGQGIDAWTLFSGRPVDATALRRALQDDASPTVRNQPR